MNSVEMVSAVRAAELSIGKKDYVLTEKQMSGKLFLGPFILLRM